MMQQQADQDAVHKSIQSESQTKQHHARRSPAGAHLAGVPIVLHKLLQRAQLSGAQQMT